MKDSNAENYTGLLDAAKRDRLFATQPSVDEAFGDSEPGGFAFGEQVAEVFDDMIPRSVPYYLDLQMLSASCADRLYQPDTAIYDLGCSTGTALTLIAKRLPHVFDLYGIDSSKPMLERAQQKLASLEVLGQVILKNERIQDLAFKESSLILANYTLQFLPIVDRQMVLEKIYRALTADGGLLITEKTKPTTDPDSAELIRELHEDFKFQNGYSQIEIAQKREKLHGVLQPLTEQENLELLKNVGFSKTIELMRGYSFITWLCVK